jgi:CBS domain-containing protein
MFVRSWMTTPAVSVASEATLYEASLLMDRKRIRRLPVVDGAHALAGILTRSDIAAEVGKSLKTESAKRRLQDTPVAKVMSRNPIHVSPKDTLDAAAQIMLRKKVSGLPVVDGERLVGMVTESDLFYALCTILGFTQTGGRVVLNLQPDSDVLGQLQKAVGRFSVQGIVSYYNPESKSWEAVVRLRGRKSGQ